MREVTLTNLVHPSFIDGRSLWIEPDVARVLDRIQNGDPVKGWEGDPRLAVYYEPQEKRWELWRLENDGQYRLFCRSKPGAQFDESIIDALIAHATRRGFNPRQHVLTVNEGISWKRSQEMSDYIEEHIAPALQYGLRRQFDGMRKQYH